MKFNKILNLILYCFWQLIFLLNNFQNKMKLKNLITILIIYSLLKSFTFEMKTVMKSESEIYNKSKYKI